MAVEHLTWQQSSYDTTPWLPEQRRATFFEAEASSDGSSGVTELEEKRVIGWMMGNFLARTRLLEALRLPAGTAYRTEVVRPFYVPRERDIDLILCAPGSPQEAMALECKRIKVRSLNPDQDQINKLKEIAHGVDQANELYNGRNGFFQTYLCVITEVECFAEAGAFEADENIPNRGVRNYTRPASGDKNRTTLRQIIEFPGRDRLHEHVGIIHFEIVQPSPISIDRRGNIRAMIYRRAVSRDQSSAMTKRVMDIMR